jgi:CRP-like cAMP-binding protein
MLPSRARIAGVSIRAVFINASEQRQEAAGQTVFAEGDSGNEMFGVISGAVELRKGDRVLTTLGVGDTFGELSIISDAPRNLTAVATEECVLAVIDEKTFLYLVHETPMFAIQVMRSMADRIREHDLQ